jgi:hypothetical protein
MPETIGFFILNALGVVEIGGVAVTAATATIVGNVAVSAALVGANYALASHPEAPRPQDGQQTVRQSTPSRRRSYGLVMVGGPLLFSEAKNGRRYQIQAINHGEIDSFFQHFLDENEASVASDGSVINLNTLNGVHYVAIKTLTGTDDDPAFVDIRAAYPSLWTPAHQGKGIAKAFVLLSQPKDKEFTTVYRGGQPPAYRAAIKAVKVWDPRDPSQNRNNKSTWTWTRNAVLISLDHHRHPDGMGLAAFDEFFFTDAAIAEDWIPAANICDEILIQKSGDQVQRYLCSGGYELSTPPKLVQAAILTTCDGQTYQRSDGAIGIRVGKLITPTVHLTDEHILSYDGFTFGPTDSLVPVNQVTAKFTSANIQYQANDAQPWRDLSAIVSSGKIETREIDLTWVPYHNQARRLMKVAAARFAPECSGKIVTGLYGLVAANERYVRVTISELGIVDGIFEITSAPEISVGSEGVSCVFSIASIDPDIYQFDAATEEGTEPQPPDENEDDGISAPENLNTSVSGAQITLTWDASGRDGSTAEAEYAEHGTDKWAALTVDLNSAVTPTLAAGFYDLRVRFVSGTRTSEWSSVFNVHVI